MLAIKGIYDGKTIKALEKTPVNQKFKLVIAFIEELDDTEEIRDLTSQTETFSFWENSKEDLYQDYLNKK